MKGKRKIPINMSNEEESLFWDSHDFLDYIDDTNIVEISISQDLKEDILLRHKERIKKMTFNVYMSGFTANSGIDDGKNYIYMQTKSNVNYNPYVKDKRIVLYNYPRATA